MKGRGREGRGLLVEVMVLCVRCVNDPLMVLKLVLVCFGLMYG